MAVPRSESQRERDRLIISDLYVQGWTQQAIADKLGLNKNTVNSDVKFLLAEWKKQRNGLVDEFEGKYRYIHREAVTAWHRSKEDAETTIQEIIDGGELGGDALNKGRLKASTRKEGQSGNPALLAQAQGALKAIREMFGVDAAKAGESDDKPFIVKVVYGNRDQRANDTSTPATPETNTGD